MCFSAAAATLLLSTVATVAGPLGAQESDCTFSVDLGNARLLNNDNSPTAGPFDVEIDAGTYTVSVVTSDVHDVFSGEPQLEEQLHIVLDSGYRSPVTDDIPEDVNEITTVFTGQVIEDSASLTVEHAQIGFGINSLFATSVCFTEEGSVETVQVPLPVCELDDSDPDGDGYGYENGASCEVAEVLVETVEVFVETNPTVTVTETVQVALPVCELDDSDPDGDGYGYENGASCEVAEVLVETVEQFIETNPTTTETVNVTVPFAVCESADSDSDGDGYGYENGASCEVTQVLTQVNEVFVETNPTTTETVNVSVPFPVCESAESDPDGNGFGFENGVSCEVTQVITEVVEVFEAGNPTVTEFVEVTVNYPVCQLDDSDPDGDGYGYEDGRTCEVTQVLTEFIEVFEAGNPTITEYVEVTVPFPVCASAETDTDFDGFGYEDGQSCQVPQVVIETVEVTAPPVSTVVEGAVEVAAPAQTAPPLTEEVVVVDEVAGTTAPAVEATEIVAQVEGITVTAPVLPQVDSTTDTTDTASAAPVSGAAAAPVLAFTGPSEVWKLLMMMSAVLFALGALCMRWGRLV